MNRPALLFLALFLVGCHPAPLPTPPPVLVLTRLDNGNVAATLQPPPLTGYWTLHLSDECGASDGPATGGDWPETGVVTVEATRGHLFTAIVLTREGHWVTVSDCVPEVAWNLARSGRP